VNRCIIIWSFVTLWREFPHVESVSVNDYAARLFQSQQSRSIIHYANQYKKHSIKKLGKLAGLYNSFKHFLDVPSWVFSSLVTRKNKKKMHKQWQQLPLHNNKLWDAAASRYYSCRDINWVINIKTPCLLLLASRFCKMMSNNELENALNIRIFPLKSAKIRWNSIEGNKLDCSFSRNHNSGIIRQKKKLCHILFSLSCLI
jgi:hypothetical protein